MERIAGYDKYKIGDEFKVPRKPVYDPDDSEHILINALCNIAPEVIYDLYVKLPDSDKLLDNSQKDSVE